MKNIFPFFYAGKPVKAHPADGRHGDWCRHMEWQDEGKPRRWRGGPIPPPATMFNIKKNKEDMKNGIFTGKEAAWA